MPSLQVAEQSYELDEDGHLVDFDAWNEDVARALALNEGIDELVDDHMRVLRTMRAYYREFRVAPMIHLLAKECGKTYKQLHTLFKKQPGKRAAKLAGLPKATGCT